MELLFSVPFSLAEHIGVESVGFSSRVSQKLEIDFIMSWTLRRQLHICVNAKISIDANIYNV